MKVIGAGFGRTGTLSLKHALEELGYGPCYHMKTALTRPWHIPFWLKAEKKNPEQWKRFFRRYNATVDWPASEFYAELMGIWPESKVILTYRDPDSWYDSALKTIYHIQDYFPWWFPKIFIRMQEKHIWQGRFKGRFQDRDYAVNNFLEHMETVKRTVPGERLLLYNVKDGWEPLCQFLGVPVPDRSFPHLHDAGTYLAYIRKVKVWAGILSISMLIMICTLLVIIFYL